MSVYRTGLLARGAAPTAALVAALALGVGCGPDEGDDGVCEPNASRGCTCESGGEGTQSCNIYGSGWGRCLCAGGDAGLDAGTGDRGGLDAGSADTAAPDSWQPDTAQPDTTSPYDATLPSEPNLRQVSIPAQSQGPIPIRVEVHTPVAFQLGLAYDRGAGEVAATLFEAASDLPTPAPVDHVVTATLVWDSYSDIPDDAAVTLHLSYDDGGGSTPLGEPIVIEVRNDPDGTRLLLATHPSGMLDGGGSSNVNTKVSVLTIAVGGTGSDTGRDVTVGTGPDMVAFADHGALAVVHNGGDGTLSLLDVSGSTVTPRATPISLAPAWISAFALAPDARAMFVLASGAGVSSLVEYELVDGVPVERRSIDFDSVAACLGVSPRGDHIAVSRADPDGERLLEVLDRRSLALVGSLPYTHVLCESVRFSHDGALVAVTGGVFGGGVTIFNVSTPAAPAIADVADLEAPYDALFHPAGTALLASDLGRDQVIPYAVSPQGTLTAGTPVSGGLPLAAEMAMLLRGSRAGLCAVSALSSAVLVQLNADGSAVKTGTIDTGDSYEDSVEGLAFSP